MSVCYIKHSCQILTAATVYAKISVSGKTFWREKKKLHFQNLNGNNVIILGLPGYVTDRQRNHVYQDVTSCVFLPADLL